VPVSLPPTRLAALAGGEGDPAARSLRVTAHAAYRLEPAGLLWNPVNLAAGQFDLVFVVVLLLPIVVIALTFDLLSREKESGRLALVIAQGVPLRSFVLARALSHGLVVLAVMCVTTLVVVLAAGGIAALWPAGLAWLLVTCLYGSFWFALALGVNALGRESDYNGVILASSWLLLVLIIPALVNLLAVTLYPAPSRVLLTTEIRAAAAEVEQRAARAREDFLYDHPELTGGPEAQEAYFRQVLETDAAVANSIEPLQREFALQAQRREVLVSRLALLSPAMLTRQWLLHTAGADAARQRAWRAAVDDFHAEWSAFMAVRIRAATPVSSQDIDSLPALEFTHQVEPWRMVDALWLLAMTSALLVFAVMRLRRYRVAGKE